MAHFAPLSHSFVTTDDSLSMALLGDDLVGADAVALRQTEAGELSMTLLNAPDAADTRVRDVQAQVERLFGLDVDSRRYDELGANDPVVHHLQRYFPGLRPVSFPTPYEAAVWSILVARSSMAQAAAVRWSMVQELGTPVSVGSATLHAFPGPERLVDLKQVSGIAHERVDRIRGIARAALEGQLDVRLLQGMSYDEAIAHLCSMRGLGPFFAVLVYLRSTGVVDLLPTTSPTVRQAIAAVYGLPDESAPEHLETIAERWRPFRTWVSVLVTVYAERGPAPGQPVVQSARRPFSRRAALPTS